MQPNFEDDVSQLENNILPENWEWISCSKQAKMARYNGSPVCYFKEFIPKSFLEKLKMKFRGTRCEVWVKQAHIAMNAGFEVPEIVATGVLKNHHHYLITASGPSGAVPEYILKKPKCDEQKRQEFIKAFGSYIGKMHRAGIVHGDLRAGNILMEPSLPPLFVMIDIERNSQHNVIPISLVKKNLIQLIKRISFDQFSAKDRLLFYKHYNSSYQRFDDKQQKKLAYDVIGLVKKQNLWGGSQNVSQ
ncbi:lipopolysaccharide kinase InaA family protein [Endozoicomonas sp. 8E]|uniref:lipopolysaccharide kinase InaA family protein n=1 Tax=Endozoicomonas sp. 8E TaxID=3035692 RepID=UPI00293932D8|nr:lipopolysaccharide kinase InaA family protein [Endozoicomonas sp. 8E]WOG28446.1 lipopolysaccharide kinase InaA family protein [Endozoicomonas sp. 8E]